jgi:hypothetical protein
MKKYTTPAIFALLLFLVVTSCTKTTSLPAANPTRKIKYELYTNIDFSGNNDVIKFSLLIRSHTKILLDSQLAPMKIMEIPNAANKIIIEKTVPDNDTSALSVGFLYAIEGVGNSWHLDTCKAGEIFKVVEFAFQ